MEVRKGYRQTDIGPLPQDWKVEKVRSFARITTGAKNTQDRIEDGAYPFFVRSQTVERINSYSFDGEAVLTAGDGVGTGKVFHYINGRFDLHQRVYKISDFKEYADGYFFYLFFSRSFLYRVMSMTAKSSVDSVRMEMIADMLAPLPPKPEQTAIATALSDTDSLIRGLEKLIAKKRAIKQGAMQELLTGKRRLLGFEGKKGFQKTEIGEIPIDWQFEFVGNFTLSHRQGFYTKDKYVDDGVLLVRITDMYNPKLDYTSMPKLKITDKYFQLYKIRKGDFLFARSGAIGRYGIVYNEVQAVFGSYIIRFTFDTQVISNKYFGFVFEMNFVLKQLLAITQGSSNININAGNIKQLQIPLPSSEEQTAIASILSDMDSSLSSLESKLSKYRAIKQGMMQELLTGKTRLV